MQSSLPRESCLANFYLRAGIQNRQSLVPSSPERPVLLDGRPFVELEPDERAVEMNAGCTDKFHRDVSIRSISCVFFNKGITNSSLARVIAT